MRPNQCAPCNCDKIASIPPRVCQPAPKAFWLRRFAKLGYHHCSQRPAPACPATAAERRRIVVPEPGREASIHITKPIRATHTYRQRLNASADRVFPLLCPVREVEWANGWLPEFVASSCGVVERDCVFITPDKRGCAIWHVTCYEPERWFVEMLKIVPGVTACRLEIQLSENGDGCFANSDSPAGRPRPAHRRRECVHHMRRG